jgi:hypothetical protein
MHVTVCRAVAILPSVVIATVIVSVTMCAALARVAAFLARPLGGVLSLLSGCLCSGLCSS